MLSMFTRKGSSQQGPAAPAPAVTPEERGRALAAITTEATGARLERLAADLLEIREAERRLRDVLAATAAQRAALEAEHLAESSARERERARLGRQLTEGAPEELAQLAHDVQVLIEHARTKADTSLWDGFETLAGRRPTLVATNVEAVTALVDAARRVAAEIEAQQHAERPDVEALGPFAEIQLPGAQLQRAQRADDPGEFVTRVLIVPAVLGELWAAATGGTPRARDLLTPAEKRHLEADAEEANRRRWGAGAWR